MIKQPFKFEGDANSRCPRCGAAFHCGARAGEDHCWCMDLPSVKEVNEESRDCLCPECMARELEHNKK